MLRLDWNVVFTIINLIVLYLLLKKFLIGPVVGIMKKRQDMIDSGIENANIKQAEALELKERYEGVIKGVREESQMILEKARVNAGKEYLVAVQKAESDSKRLLTQAEAAIRAEREQILEDLKAEVASLALVTARKVLAKQSEQEMSQSLYQQFLVEVGEAYDTNSK